MNEQGGAGEAVDTESLYKLLDLPKTCTTEEIKKSFRRKAMKEHPDKGGDPERFRALKEASEILSDPEKRELYNQYGMEGVKAGGDPKGGDIFDLFRGQKQKGPKKCRPKLVEVHVGLDKVYEGGIVNMEVERMRVCEACEGKGGANSKTCPDCNGQRVVEKLVKLGPGQYGQTSAACATCKAQGVIFEQADRCKVCNGDRVVKNTKKFDIAIDPGVPNSHDYIMSGEADQYPGALAGDIYFRILIDDNPDFGRKGADLYHVHKISLLQALTGVCFELKMLDGTVILIASAPKELIGHDMKKVVKGKGMPFYKDSMSKGNLIVIFEIDFPKKGEIDPKSYKALSEILGQPLNPEAAERVGDANYLEEYKEAEKEEGDWEDEEGEGQGQAVQCQQQ